LVIEHSALIYLMHPSPVILRLNALRLNDKPRLKPTPGDLTADEEPEPQALTPHQRNNAPKQTVL